MLGWLAGSSRSARLPQTSVEEIDRDRGLHNSLKMLVVYRPSPRVGLIAIFLHGVTWINASRCAGPRRGDGWGFDCRASAKARQAGGADRPAAARRGNLVRQWRAGAARGGVSAPFSARILRVAAHRAQPLGRCLLPPLRPAGPGQTAVQLLAQLGARPLPRDIAGLRLAD